MSKLRTYQLQNPDSATVNIELDQSGGTTVSGILTASSGVVGNVTGNVTGTATTATNLADAANITTGTISNDRLPATITKNLTGNVTGNLTGNLESTASLAGISSSISDTAVDVFVYDTRKDSDGGAWRKRTQHTSWYNETLNTATRGSRREFPAVAVIVAEGSAITIYDGDDPDLPMWMKFISVSGGDKIFNRPEYWSSSSVYALNGIVCITNSQSAAESTLTIRYVNDSAILYPLSGYASYGGVYSLGISERSNSSGTFAPISQLIVNSPTNDVAMTVLPNAPIDSATGLPVPTIAVATDGGVSIIKDDGTVVDVTASSSTYGESNDVDFTSDNKLITIWNNSGGGNYGWVYVIDIPTSDETLTVNSRDVGLSWFDTRYEMAFSQDAWILSQRNNVNGEKLTDLVGESDSISAATSRGLTRIVEGSRPNGNNALVSYATTSYNTGWMHDNIRGAFLSDTDTTNVTGSELVTNGTFTTDLTGWTDNSEGNGTASVVSSALQLYTPTQSSEEGRVSQQITTLTSGKTYVLSATTDAAIILQVGVSAVGASELVNQTITGPAGLTFTATSSSVYLSVRKFTAGTANVDNISLRLAEEDRSVNNNGLQVFGTVTKSAVATGAELVAYSGFNTSNYLLQPYNSDFEIGTGDFTHMLWYKGTGSAPNGSIGAREVFTRTAGTTNYWILYKEYTNYFGFGGIYSPNTVQADVWYHVAVVRKSGVAYLYENGVLVNSAANSTDYSDTSGGFMVGQDPTNGDWRTRGYLSLVRFSTSTASSEQIKKIYEDEKVLFQENAACTLYGSSDAVTALAYDDSTNLLYAGTSSGRSDFQGLRRINNTTTAVTTAMSASNGLVAEQ